MRTERLYYEDAYLKTFSAVVISCEKQTGNVPASEKPTGETLTLKELSKSVLTLAGNKGKERSNEDSREALLADRWLIELNRTAFYPEGGGQPADTGILACTADAEIGADEDSPAHTGVNIDASTGVNTGINLDENISSNVHAAVIDVREDAGRILHITDRPIVPGAVVTGSIDWERRFDHMQQHSGEHIVSGMICKSFGCDNVGFHLGSEMVTIDYNAEIDMESLKEIETQANRYISEAHTLEVMFPEPAELKNLSFRSKKELTEEVRITSFPGADTCACCGTHVKNSAEVGLVKFISCRRFTKGTRIELLCGKRAVDLLSVSFEENSKIARKMAASLDHTAAVYNKQLQEFNRMKLKFSELEQKYFEELAKSYEDKGDVLLFTESMSPDSVRKLCVLIGQTCKGRCAVFSADFGHFIHDSNTSFENVDRKNTSEVKFSGGYKYAVVHKEHDINDLIKAMNTALGGRGGGKNGFAQGSVTASEQEIRKFFAG